jgi:hypothetical protein
MKFWGVVFLVATSLVAVLKHEREEEQEPGDQELGIVDTYKLVFWFNFNNIQRTLCIFGSVVVDTLTFKKDLD